MSHVGKTNHLRITTESVSPFDLGSICPVSCADDGDLIDNAQCAR